MATEVRLYTINRGMMDSWLKAFKEKIMPTSAQFGIRIHAAWVNRPQNEFIWIRSYDSAELLDAYYKSPERAAYGEHVGVRSQHIVDTKCSQHIVDISARCSQHIVDIGHPVPRASPES